MSHVFISYSRRDSEFAKQLNDELKHNKFSTFFDTSDIDPGEPWKTRILEAIETCSAFVIILSYQSARSDWVMRELLCAKECKRQIFPLLKDGESDEPWPLLEGVQYARSIKELLQKLGGLARLFISHVPEDGEFSARLKSDLAALEANIWQPDDQTSSVQDGLNQSQIMLLVVSPESMASDDIKAQWHAFDTAGKRIIPILARHASAAAGLREKQPYIDFLKQDYRIAFAQLYGVLTSLDVNLRDHEKVPVPPQPKLPLNGFDMINEAKQAIWISGLTLDIFSRRSDVLQQALTRDSPPDIRLLMLDLDVRVANEVGAWTGINHRIKLPPNLAFEDWVSRQDHPITSEGRWIAQRLFENREVLGKIYEQARDNVEVRTISYRLGTGYFIVDPDLEEGMLTATPYVYGIDNLKETLSTYYTSPIFLSRRSSTESDSWWFGQYVQEFERLWGAAAHWEPGVLPGDHNP